jgi:hypothetical protein
MRAEVFRQGDIAGVVVILLDGRDRFYLVGGFLRKLVSWDLLVDAMRQVDDATKPGGLHRIGVPLRKQQQSYGQRTTNNKRKKLHYSSADPSQTIQSLAIENGSGEKRRSKPNPTLCSDASSF